VQPARRDTRRIDYTTPEGKAYRLKSQTAVLFVRPRGWHLPRSTCLSTASPSPAASSIFALYFFHNARELLARGSGPYFYLPKLESHLEARLWNDVFVLAQDELGVPRGSIRATVLIETLLAAFEMDEILYELREHSAGLNCGRWDYIFSCIKKLAQPRDSASPIGACHDDDAFHASYALLLVKTCHRRNIHAMGGMAAQIPVKNDEAANAEAFAKVKADKEREATQGHDGTWVAHPGSCRCARGVRPADADAEPDRAKKRDDVQSPRPTAPVRAESADHGEGLRLNINVAIQYVGAWLVGQGAVPIYNLMEDAATAEISRSQVWQWIRSSKGRSTTAARSPRKWWRR
jgi:malate synthase